MSNLGTMEGWHGDENECYGSCGLCSSCDDQYYEEADEAYETWRDEEAA